MKAVQKQLVTNIRDKRLEHEKMVEKQEKEIADLHLDLDKWKQEHDDHLGVHDHHKKKLTQLELEEQQRQKEKERQKKMNEVNERKLQLQLDQEEVQKESKLQSLAELNK